MVDSGPQLLRPSPALAGFVDFFGYWQRDAATVHRSRALPRGAATIVIDVSAAARVDFFESDGHTRIAVPSAFIAGPGDSSYVTQVSAAQTVLTVHFKPAAGLPFLGAALGGLQNVCAGLSDIWGRDADVLVERLIAAPSAAARIAVMERFLLSHADLSLRAHPGVSAVLDAVERHPSLRVAEAGRIAGLSPKRLITRFRAEVGQSPKSYVRVRRLQAALRALDTGVLHGSTVAAELGYFDQSHFVREFRGFTAMTPSQYAERRLWLPSHVGLGREKYPIPPTARLG
jgi:AraC-like DNA-binding protein